jgi:hypothetical protein
MTTIFDTVELSGPLKINGISKTNKFRNSFTGWFYPIFLTRKEAIQEDINRGGQGIYQVTEFFDRDGEFYSADSYFSYGEEKDPLIYTLHSGAGAENPFSKIQNRLSLLIENQLPDFVQTDYGMFVTFLKAYYEFLEQNNQAQELLQDITKYADIDETSEEMINKFLANYAQDVSSSNIADNRILIKRIREIYNRKGTETAYRILFNILYKETIEFFYPYDIVLKTSSGKWNVPTALRVKQSDARQNIFDFTNTEITGEISKSTAIVDDVQKINVGGFDVYELILDTKSTKGIFTAGEKINAIKSVLLDNVIDKSNLSASLYSVISKIDIVDGKRGYKKGSPIKSIIDNEGNGISAKAKISEVNRFGTIIGIETENSGINYSNNIIIDVGAPTESINGKYSIKNGVVTITFPAEHNITKGTLLNIKYTGNILSPVDNTSHNVKVVSVPNIRSIRFKYPGF